MTSHGIQSFEMIQLGSLFSLFDNVRDTLNKVDLIPFYVKVTKSQWHIGMSSGSGSGSLS